MNASNRRGLICFLIVLLICSLALAAGNDEYTKLLIHSDSTNGHTFFHDSSVGNSVGRIFDSDRAHFDGSGDYLSVADHADWDFGTGDFTIDFWVNASMIAASELAFVNRKNDVNNRMYARFNSLGNLTWYFVIGGTYTGVGSVDSLGIGAWHHVAVVRNGSAYTFYLDGAVKGTNTLSSNIDYGSSLDIGYDIGSGDAYFKGYLDEFRVSKGMARWTNSFTPPTAPYTSDTNTSLLLHMGGTDNSFTDSGPTGHVVTANGDVCQTGGHGITANDDTQHTTNLPYFGATSMHFDGTADCLSVPDSIDFNLTSGDWTMDFWVFKKTDTDRLLLAKMKSTPPYTGYYMYSFGSAGNDGLQFVWGDNNWNLTVSNALAYNGWHHVAMVSTGTVLKMYVDGTEIGSRDGPPKTDYATDLLIGKHPIGASLPLNGYIDEFRMSKGIARWTSNFTPPTAPYSTAKAGTVILVR